MKKIISILTAMLLMIALLPTAVFADDTSEAKTYIITYNGDDYAVTGVDTTETELNQIITAIKDDSATKKTIQFGNGKDPLVDYNDDVVIDFDCSITGKIKFDFTNMYFIIGENVNVTINADIIPKNNWEYTIDNYGVLSITGGNIGGYIDNYNEVRLSGSPNINRIDINEKNNKIVVEDNYNSVTKTYIKIYSDDFNDGDTVIENYTDTNKFEVYNSEFMIASEGNNLIIKDAVTAGYLNDTFDDVFLFKIPVAQANYDNVKKAVEKPGYVSYLYYEPYVDDNTTIKPVVNQDTFQEYQEYQEDLEYKDAIGVFYIKDNTVNIVEGPKTDDDNYTYDYDNDEGGKEYWMSSDEIGISNNNLNDLCTLINNLLPIYNINNPTIVLGNGTDTLVLDSDINLDIDCRLTGNVSGNIAVSKNTTIAGYGLVTDNPVKFMAGSKLINETTKTGNSLYANNELVDEDKTFSEDTDVTFTFKPSKYNISYELDGGTVSDSTDTYTYGNEVTLSKPSKKGYTFKGWYDNAEFNGNAITEITSTDVGNKTLFAKWERVQLEMLDGNNSKWTEGSKDELKFRSEADIKDFINVTINGKIVDPKNYTVTEGSTIITFKPEFLATLTAGTYTISINSTTGIATTEFTINPSNTNSNSEKADNPKTGNNIPVSLMILSGLSLAGFIFTKKRVK